jgi:hypothetical protein
VSGGTSIVMKSIQQFQEKQSLIATLKIMALGWVNIDEPLTTHSAASRVGFCHSLIAW